MTEQSFKDLLKNETSGIIRGVFVGHEVCDPWGENKSFSINFYMRPDETIVCRTPAAEFPMTSEGYFYMQKYLNGLMDGLKLLDVYHRICETL